MGKSAAHSAGEKRYVGLAAQCRLVEGIEKMHEFNGVQSGNAISALRGGSFQKTSGHDFKSYPDL
jgi:3-deoxy-D-arabino-heptulosonate 7-phosphate (DAHP) synthase